MTEYSDNECTLREAQTLIPGDVVAGVGTVATWPVPADLKNETVKVSFEEGEDRWEWADETIIYSVDTELYVYPRSPAVTIKALFAAMTGEQEKAINDAVSELVENATEEDLRDAAVHFGVENTEVSDERLVTDARLNVETVTTAVRRRELDPNLDLVEHADMTGAMIDEMDELELKSGFYLACSYIAGLTCDLPDERFTHIFNCEGDCEQ